MKLNLEQLADLLAEAGYHEASLLTADADAAWATDATVALEMLTDALRSARAQAVEHSSLSEDAVIALERECVDLEEILDANRSCCEEGGRMAVAL